MVGRLDVARDEAPGADRYPAVAYNVSGHVPAAVDDVVRRTTLGAALARAQALTASLQEGQEETGGQEQQRRLKVTVYDTHRGGGSGAGAGAGAASGPADQQQHAQGGKEGGGEGGSPSYTGLFSPSVAGDASAFGDLGSPRSSVSARILAHPLHPLNRGVRGGGVPDTPGTGLYFPELYSPRVATTMASTGPKASTANAPTATAPAPVTGVAGGSWVHPDMYAFVSGLDAGDDDGDDDDGGNGVGDVTGATEATGAAARSSTAASTSATASATTTTTTTITSAASTMLADDSTGGATAVATASSVSASLTASSRSVSPRLTVVHSRTHDAGLPRHSEASSSSSDGGDDGGVDDMTAAVVTPVPMRAMPEAREMRTIRRDSGTGAEIEMRSFGEQYDQSAHAAADDSVVTAADLDSALLAHDHSLAVLGSGEAPEEGDMLTADPNELWVSLQGLSSEIANLQTVTSRMMESSPPRIRAVSTSPRPASTT